MLGKKGLKKCSEIAILNANYIKKKLEKDFKILYTGNNDTVAHELILDCILVNIFCVFDASLTQHSLSSMFKILSIFCYNLFTGFFKY